MPKDQITYNDYKFSDRSNYQIREEYLYDDAGITVVATQFSLQVKTIIVAEPEPSPNDPYTAKAYNCGPEMHKVRQKLSKAGALLELIHDGFGPDSPYITVGGSPGNPVKDIRFGPKPRFLSWNPVGNTAAVEVVWECTFALPVCDGGAGPRFTGVSAFNYAVSYDIDKRGFTTRRITGYIEISMTRTGADRRIPDSVDRYRDQVKFHKPANFTRDVSWNVSVDKRRADFSITDTEIASNNPYPAGVVSISSKHRVGYRKNRAELPNTISATIELSPKESRLRAWEIYRAIVAARIQYANNIGYETWLDTLEVEEELFENRISFACNYRILKTLGIADMFRATGLLQPLSTSNDGTWEQWAESMVTLNPFQENNTDRGIAKLKHDFLEDKIIDPCDNDLFSRRPEALERPLPTGVPIQTFCNKRLPAAKSWISFDADFIYDEHSYAFDAVTLGPDDLRNEIFNPAKPDASLSQEQQESIVRYVENYAGVIGLRWQGYAERACYPIPKPGKLTIGNVTLIPAGKGTFKPAFVGNYFCQPKYQAMWDIPYKLQERPAKIDGADASMISVPDSENAS